MFTTKRLTVLIVLCAVVCCTKQPPKPERGLASDATNVRETVSIDEPSASGDGGCDARSELGEAEAIKRAEQFVAVNGYTDTNVKLDLDTVYVEPNWRSFSRQQRARYVELRRGSLKARAAGVKRTEGGGWQIVFPYNTTNEKARRMYETIGPPDAKPSMEEVGTVIVMDAHGCEVDVAGSGRLENFLR